MDLRRGRRGLPGHARRPPSRWLNLALCAMHFPDYAAAHEYLQKAKAELPLRPGLSRARRSTTSGVALEQARLPAAGRRGLPRGGRRKDATLINNDGPAVAPASPRAGRARERERPPRLGDAPTARSVEFPLDAEMHAVGRDEDVATSGRRAARLAPPRPHRAPRRRLGGVDLGSTNFTRVNGQRVRRERELTDGDELQFGRARCRFVSAPGAEGQPEASLRRPPSAGSGPASGRAR